VIEYNRNVEHHRIRCVVNVPDGPARRVGPTGLMIGRRPDCDIVSSDPSASRRHALIRLAGASAELVPLGRGGVVVNGRMRERTVALCDGDALSVPGLQLGVRVEALAPDRVADPRWRLERDRGGSFGVVHSPFTIGGGQEDDLIVSRWPAHALRLHGAQGELYLEPAVDGVTRNGGAVARDAMEPLAAGDQFGFRRECFHLRPAAHDTTTAVAGVQCLPSRVAIELLPRGGRALFATAAGDRSVFLSDRRLDLVIALLRPPEPYRAGDFIPDDVVCPIVWPRNPGVSRTEVNVLISRCRRDLIEAGLAGSRLIERAPGGGGTRFALAPGASISLES
jgi:hypothetical protein